MQLTKKKITNKPDVSKSPSKWFSGLSNFKLSFRLSCRQFQTLFWQYLPNGKFSLIIRNDCTVVWYDQFLSDSFKITIKSKIQLSALFKWLFNILTRTICKRLCSCCKVPCYVKIKIFLPRFQGSIPLSKKHGKNLK